MIYISILCWTLAAVCNAVMDTLADKPHFDQSIFYRFNPDFWLKTDSWDNKYNDIDGDGEGDVKGGFKYKGIFRILNNLLDAWHIFQSSMIVLLATSVVIMFNHTENLNIFNQAWLNIPAWLLIYGTLWNIAFSLFYDTILKK